MQTTKIKKDKIKNIVKGKYTILVLLGIFIFLILEFYSSDSQKVSASNNNFRIENVTSSIISDNGIKKAYLRFDVKNITTTPIQVSIHSHPFDICASYQGEIRTTITPYNSYVYETTTMYFVGSKCDFMIEDLSEGGASYNITFDFTHYMLPLSNSLGEQTLEPLNVGFTPQHLRGALNIYSPFSNSHYLAINSEKILFGSGEFINVSNLGFMKDSVRKGLISGMSINNTPALLRLYSNDEKGCGIEIWNDKLITKTRGYWYNTSTREIVETNFCYVNGMPSSTSNYVFKSYTPSLVFSSGRLIFATSSASKGFRIPMKGTWCGLLILVEQDNRLVERGNIPCNGVYINNGCPYGYHKEHIQAHLFHFYTCAFVGS